MVPNINTTDGATAEHYVYAPGTNNVTMEHYKIINGAHTWPGAAITIGVTCMDFSASKEIWRFFSQYSNAEAGIKNNEMPEVRIYPNPANDILTIEHGWIGDLQISIMDAAGKLVFQRTEQHQSFTLDISAIQQGVYSIKIENGTQIINTRFSKF
jgi:polyhydroxybutyrate depolymerase